MSTHPFFAEPNVLSIGYFMLLLYVFLLFFLLTILIQQLSLQGFLAEKNYNVKKNLLQVLRTPTGKKLFSLLITMIVVSISILNVLILSQPSNKIIKGVQIEPKN
ncbi:hypothetical protein MUK42_36405 [Musa troglodytarum]|uniref:Uncharacterized protein n=1 Tax=Musa troglodytarum TaxID=320322 RepID=A0A9E7FJB0_9LILI|nr:hypothetical protein MUK42_36405 [Musa troglodytarum]